MNLQDKNTLMLLFSFKKRFSLLLCSVFWLSVNAQQSEIEASIYKSYQHAHTLYANKAYAAAQQSFIKIREIALPNTNLKADAHYFDAMCAIKLKQENADKKVLQFVAENPNDIKKNKAFYHVGNYYFANKKPAYALKWYTKVDEDALSLENRKEINFKMAYALLAAENMTAAKKRFLLLLNDSKYGNDARYFYGYIAYKQEDYTLAESTLQEIADKGSKSLEVTYFLLDINFKAGKFERCIEIGEKLVNKAKRKQKSEISKIIGESYFNLEKYKEAIPYLEAYSGKRGKLNNTDYYQLGYAYYKQENIEKAISYFNKIIDQKNNVSQNAYYNLAECYLRLDKKPEALNAFKSASEMDFNPQIKEDALLNYAKLSYEEGNPYTSVAEILQDYLNSYPKSSHYNEINALVVTSFLHQQDYQGALDYLVKKKTKENSVFTQEVSLYRGMQLFQEDKFTEALPYFTIAKESLDMEIELKAAYWKAETFYLLENYKNAMNEFLAFEKRKNPLTKNIEEFQNIEYHLGYSAFKLKGYLDALGYFKQFLALNKEDHPLYEDAVARLGDSYFAEKDYKKAIETYSINIKNGAITSDYAIYQTAMSYGFIGKLTDKVSKLESLIETYENSSLRDDALFQLGNTYADLKENNLAHGMYKKLGREFPKSRYVPRAMLRNGLLFFNDNIPNKAIETYKNIVANFPNTKEAKEAVANARNVYVDIGNVDAYAKWVKTLSFISVTDEELENTLYEAAESKFVEGNSKKAITGFTKYLERFPEGIHQLKANFYLAKLYVKVNSPEKAFEYYNYLVAQKTNEYSEEALTKVIEIHLQKEHWNKAIPLLERLELEGNFAENILFAQSNLMKGYYEAAKFTKAAAYAEKVLQQNKISKAVEYDAKIIIARTAYKTGDLQTAQEFYFTVEQNATGEVKAEALYFNAFFLNSNKEYEASNKTIQNLSANYSAYKFWGAKALVLMAKNYYSLQEVYQATYILESVIKNFSNFEEIVSEATTQLENIKKEEAKTNTSVKAKNK